MVAKMKVGIIGCGNISSAYIKHMAMFEVLDVWAVADIDMERVPIESV
jgi:predicted dehydrogenase